MTSAERKRKERARKEKSGYVRHEFWIKPQWLVKVKKYVSSLKND